MVTFYLRQFALQDFLKKSLLPQYVVASFRQAPTNGGFRLSPTQMTAAALGAMSSFDRPSW